MKLSKIRGSIVFATIFTMIPVSVVLGATGTIDGNAVRLRKDPSSSSRIITLLEKGKEAEILVEENGWVNIKIDSNIGWVSAEFFKKNDEVPGQEVATAGVTETVEVVDSTVQIVAVKEAVVNIRKEANTEASIVAKVEKGQLLKVSGLSEDGTWYKVKFAEVEGYVRNDLVTSVLSQITGEGTINGSVVNLRETASTEGATLAKLTEGAKVTIIGAEGEWYKATYSDKTGFIHSDYVTIGNSEVTSRGSSSKVQKVIEIVKKQLGKKYVWGADGPSSFDCSGLVKYVFAQVGFDLNRVSSEQAHQGIAVSRSNLIPGDVVFFRGINSSSKSKTISHVGIYIGNGEFIHASNPSRGVVKDSLSEDYYKAHYVTGRRFIR